MLAENLDGPCDYLEYSKIHLQNSGIFCSYPFITTYYYELCEEFEKNYYEENNFFMKLGKLLEIDAQIQILLELTKSVSINFIVDLGMSEKEIITMIKRDKKSFYRELVGTSVNQEPKWGLIFLSEE